ncbi:hypothetical protein LEN26_020435 [Aphanomyces euteiches]|nr:hypothetical protein LEN26_020435 [Aphanomyces euteiches]
MNFSAADEAISFLHDFHRIFGGPSVFAPYDEAYKAFLRKVAFGCFGIGLLCFALLLMIAGRRIMSVAMPSTSRAPPSYAAYTRMRRNVFHQGSNDVFAVILLGFTALSALAGLLAEAQVDYSVHRVSNSMQNVSHTFHAIQTMGNNASFISQDVRVSADDMLLSFNDSLPSNASQLVVDALRLQHASAELAKETGALPSNLTRMADRWEEEYFWMKSSTNGIILTMTLSCFLSIAAIGWSMSSTLRFAIFMILVVIPSSYGLFGIYLSNSIEAADFCVAPVVNTMTLFHNDTSSQYFVECPANATLYGPTLASFSKSLADATAMEDYLQIYAKSLPEETRKRLQVGYLDPISNQLDVLHALARDFSKASDCAPVAANHKEVVETWCTNGVLGMFSLWVHQVALCTMLFLSVIALVSVFEEVRGKEERLEMQYHLLSTYEEDNIEHLYMSPE